MCGSRAPSSAVRSIRSRVGRYPIASDVGQGKGVLFGMVVSVDQLSGSGVMIKRCLFAVRSIFAIVETTRRWLRMLGLYGPRRPCVYLPRRLQRRMYTLVLCTRGPFFCGLLLSLCLYLRSLSPFGCPIPSDAAFSVSCYVLLQPFECAFPSGSAAFSVLLSFLLQPVAVSVPSPQVLLRFLFFLSLSLVFQPFCLSLPLMFCCCCLCVAALLLLIFVCLFLCMQAAYARELHVSGCSRGLPAERTGCLRWPPADRAGRLGLHARIARGVCMCMAACSEQALHAAGSAREGCMRMAAGLHGRVCLFLGAGRAARGGGGGMRCH